ncbi:MAG TPA: hypothetical protein VJR89_42315 [Polyangiales bacterium]|nr:hypothetical protein [Polyangiales bacterium]
MSKLLAALLLLLAACAGSAQAQKPADEAIERLEAIGALQLGVLRPSGLLAVSETAAGGGGLGATALGLEKRGFAAEVVRVDRARYLSYGTFDLAFTVVDIEAWMIGTDVDHALCVAAAVIVFGDCQHGGAFGLHAQLFQHAFDGASSRWFHRWFEVGGVISPLGDSFDVDFVRGRLPLTLAVSLDQVAGVPLPEAERALHLRGLVELSGVLRSADYRWELRAGLEYRPSLAPFAASDYALGARARIAYVWLAALLGSLRTTAQRVYLETRGSHWQRPWLSDRPWLGENGLEIELGFELSARAITPS